MKDRYLFRAKRIDNGEWVFGYLSYPHCIDTEKGVESYYFYSVDMESFYSQCVVSADTICQCTGFSDEDGKKIFEGDIVGFIDCTSTENGYSEQYCRGQVTWDQETGSFQVTNRLSAESYEVLDRGCKVIGNIFDNKELLEDW